jgi:site-specific DNA recombinase
MIRKSKRADSEKIAVAYLRVSRKDRSRTRADKRTADADRESVSLDEQRKAIGDYAAKHGYTLVAEYLDDGISGDDEDRPDFNRLHVDAQKRQFEYIIVWDQDRYCRFDDWNAVEWMNKLRRSGVSLVTCDRGVIDGNDKTQRLVYSVSQIGKHDLLTSLSRNVGRAMIQNAKAGLWNGGPAPFGYAIESTGTGKRRESRLILGDEKTVAAVRGMFRKYLETESLSAVAADLNSRGVEAARNGTWNPSGVRQILSNPVYSGRMVWNRRCGSKYHDIDGNNVVSAEVGPDRLAVLAAGRKLTNDESAWIDGGECPSIVDQKTWDRAQVIMAQHERGKRLPRPNTEYALRGRVVCANCGGRMHGFLVRQGKADRERGIKPTVVGRGYKCEGGLPALKGSDRECKPYWVNEAPLLASIGRKLAALISTPDRIEKLIGKIREKAAAKAKPAEENPIEALRRKLAELDTAIPRSARRLLMVDDSLVAELSAQVEAMKVEQASLRRQIAAMERTAPVDSEELSEAAIGLIGELGSLLAQGGARVAEALRQCVREVRIEFESYTRDNERRKPGKKPRTMYRPVRGQVRFGAVGSTDLAATVGRCLQNCRLELTAADFVGAA